MMNRRSLLGQCVALALTPLRWVTDRYEPRACKDKLQRAWRQLRTLSLDDHSGYRCILRCVNAPFITSRQLTVVSRSETHMTFSVVTCVTGVVSIKSVGLVDDEGYLIGEIELSKNVILIKGDTFETNYTVSFSN